MASVIRRPSCVVERQGIVTNEWREIIEVVSFWAHENVRLEDELNGSGTERMGREVRGCVYREISSSYCRRLRAMGRSSCHKNRVRKMEAEEIVSILFPPDFGGYTTPPSRVCQPNSYRFVMPTPVD